MLDMFASAKSVLRRADHHITDLKSTIDTFALDEKYAHRVDRDPVSGKHIHKMIFSRDFSDDISCILFDAVNNLRASLDQMTYAIAMRHNPSRDPEKFSPFPFAKNIDRWPARIGGLKNNIPPDIIAVFESFKPYKGGNNILWSLNQIANIKKHAILIPAAFGGAMISVPRTLSEEVGFEFAHAPFFTGRDEVELFRTVKADTDAHVGFAPTIVIRHTEQVIDGKSPVALLQLLRVEVGIVFARTEVACEGLLGWT